MNAADALGLRLRVVTLPTQDLNAAVAFYHDLLGLDIVDGRRGEFVQVGDAEATICLDRKRRSGDPHMIMETSALDVLVNRLRESGVPVNGPQAGNDGSYILFQDPDGHRLAIQQRRKSA